MVAAYYTCNLLPAQLVARCGYSPRWLGNCLQDAAAPVSREALSIHPMTCPYVTRLVSAAEAVLGAGEGAGEDCLVVPAGCDAMRRLGDLLEAAYPGRVFSLSMPRGSTERSVRALASELTQMEKWLRDRLPTARSTEESTPAPEPPAVDYPSPPRPGGVFVVAGPLSDDSLLRLIGQLGVDVAALESCTSPDRWKRLAGLSPALLDHLALAAEMLSAGICPRRSTAERRTYLTGRLDRSEPSSVIYARQSFCDPGAYDALVVAELARERGLPFVEIEVGFPFEAAGQLRTRLEAFLETQVLDDDLLGLDEG